MSKDDFDLYQASIRKDHGDDSVKDADTLKDSVGNSSGSLSLDIDLVVPFPNGRIIEISGEEGSGKTTLALEILGQAQQKGKRIGFSDTEYRLSKSLVNSIRTLDPSAVDESGHKTFQLLGGDTGEEKLEIVRKFVSSFNECMVVVDSVDGIVPEAILNGAVGDAALGNLARLMSDGCRKLSKACERTGSTVVFINQIRDKILSYGDPRTTSGGRALRFWSSQRVFFNAISKADQIKAKVNDKDKVVGHWVRYIIKKNGEAPPFINGTIPLMYGKGVYREIEVAQFLKDFGLVDTGGKGGHQIKIDNRLYSVQKAALLFESDADLYQKYYDLIMSKF